LVTGGHTDDSFHIDYRSRSVADRRRIHRRPSDETPLESHEIKHVLLISVDGLHALDLSNFVATHADSTLAELGRHGVTYSNNSTSSRPIHSPALHRS